MSPHSVLDSLDLAVKPDDARCMQADILVSKACLIIMMAFGSNAIVEQSTLFVTCDQTEILACVRQKVLLILQSGSKQLQREERSCKPCLDSPCTSHSLVNYARRALSQDTGCSMVSMHHPDFCIKGCPHKAPTPLPGTASLEQFVLCSDLPF
jgi:hypothetical protein